MMDCNKSTQFIGRDQAPKSEEELRRSLTDGTSYLINFNWGEGRPEELFPYDWCSTGVWQRERCSLLEEVYGAEYALRAAYPNLPEKPWPMFERDDDDGDPQHTPSALENLSLSYLLSDIGRLNEDKILGSHAHATQQDGPADVLPGDAYNRRGNRVAEVRRVFQDLDDTDDDSSNSSLSEWSTAYTRESSVETDLLSAPHASQDHLPWTPEPGMALFPEADVLARQLLNEFGRTAAFPTPNDSPAPFQAHGTPDERPQNGGSLSPHPPHRDGAMPFQGSFGRGTNERNSGHGGGSSDGEGARRRHPKRTQRRSGSEKPKKPFACPFFISNPREHHRCFKLTLNDTARVKQHLRRIHAPKYYCERCMEKFRDTETHGRHVRQERMTCSPGTSPFSALTHEQQRRLSRKSSQTLSPEEKWFEIWGIAFPDRPRPASPYLDDHLPENLKRFKKFAELRGPGLIAEQLRLASPILLQELHAEVISRRLEDCISDGISSLFAQWMVQEGLSEALTPSSTEESPTTMVTGREASFEAARPVESEMSGNPTAFPGGPAQAEDTLQREPPTLPPVLLEEQHEGEEDLASYLLTDDFREDVGATEVPFYHCLTDGGGDFWLGESGDFGNLEGSHARE
jgi:hypothetical protein